MKTLTKPTISRSQSKGTRKFLHRTHQLLVAASLFTASGFASAVSTQPLVIADTSHIATKGFLASGQADLNHLLTKQNRFSSTVQANLPMPDKTFKSVTLTLIPELSPALSSVYQIRTFSVSGAGVSGQLSSTPKGIDAFIYTPQGPVMISSINPSTSLSYFTEDATRDQTAQAEQMLEPFDQDGLPANLAARPAGSTDLKTYTIAFSTTSEYAEQLGATSVADVMSELATMLTVINPIFERELNVRFRLSDQNDQVIFLNNQGPADPFTGNPNQDIEINTDVIEQRIGLDKVDLAHVLSANNGGLATVDSVCVMPRPGSKFSKASAFSGFEAPSNNYFYISLVAHEIGHQLGARHSFNATTTQNSTCQANRSGSTAWEPLSGSTIMSYVGLCPGANNLDTGTTFIPGFGRVAMVDPFFHIGSINEIKNSERSFECGVNTRTNNTAPTVSAPGKLVVPVATPFMLSGSASDPEATLGAQKLSYRWEQYQNIVSNSALINNPNDLQDQPLFRSFQPQDVSYRFFPQFSSVLSGNLVKGEQYAQVNRFVDLNLSVDDGAGLLTTAGTEVQTAGVCPYKVLEPTSQTRWAAGSQRSIYWDRADSDLSPINCNSVDIVYSPDNFSTDSVQFLTRSAPNTGSARVTAPQNLSSNARIAVICHKEPVAGLNPSNSPFANTFYAVSPATFRVTTPALASAQVAEPSSLNNTCGSRPQPVVNPPINPNTPSSSADSGGSGGGSLSPALLLSLALSCLIVACARYGSPAVASTGAQANEIDQEVLSAIEAEDYRLYALAGRFTTLPGIAPAEQQELMDLCGIKFLDASEAIEMSEAAEWKAKVDRASIYNQSMQSECLKRS